MSNDSEKSGGSKAMMSVGFFLMIVLLVLGTWAVLAYSGCTPKNNGFFGSYCNPFPFGEGGSCGGGSSSKAMCVGDPGCDGLSQPECVMANKSTNPSSKINCGWFDCAEPYRRFNRSPRRREGYRRFARR